MKNNVVKKDIYDAKIKNNEDNISGISNLATKTTLNANSLKREIPSLTNLAITSKISLTLT